VGMQTMHAVVREGASEALMMLCLMMTEETMMDDGLQYCIGQCTCSLH
jgi:hypothetical protein